LDYEVIVFLRNVPHGNLQREIKRAMKNIRKTRVVGLGMLFAVVGFSYAVAVSENVVGGGAESRASGSSLESVVGTLRFANPILDAGISNDFPLKGDAYDPAVHDLGDAVIGTNPIQRYLTAAGGVPPYVFAEGTSNIPTLTAIGLTLSANGLLSGSVTSNSTTAALAAYVFTAKVTDGSTGTNKETAYGRFYLGLVPAGQFRFLVSSLSDGLLGLEYSAKLDVVGGVGNVTFEVVSGTVKVGATVKESLEDVGLGLAEDGTVSGRPLAVGTITFTAKATDDSNNVALGRYPSSAENQVVSVVVADNEQVTSNLTTLKCSIKGDSSKEYKDSLKYSGILNLVGSSVTDVSGKEFSFKIGNRAFSGMFDAKGKYKTGKEVKTDKLSASISTTKGSFTFGVSSGDLLSAVGSVSGSTKTLVIQVVVQDIIVASEVLEFDASKSKSPKFSLEYALGKTGKPMAGAFQITSAKGTDKDSGDIWKLKFLAVPRLGIDGNNAGFTGVSSVNVMLGSSFSQTYVSNDTESGNVKYKESSSGVQVTDKRKVNLKKVKLDNKKYVSTVDTNVLTEDQTGIEQASSSSSEQVDLALGLVVEKSSASSPGFTGVTSKVLSKSKKNWTDAIK
jgi:hypothetical protein